MSTIDVPEVDRRTLPLYEAGSVEVPYVIDGMDEAINRNTFWEEHSHPTHELIWNTRGASSLTVGSRTWTITPAVGLWIPAGVRHTAWTPAGTWYRTAMFSVQTTTPIADEPVAVDVTDLLRLLLDRLAEPGLDDASRSKTEAMVLDILAPAPHELVLRIPEAELLIPIVRSLEADVRDGRTLEEWSTQLGVSARTITRQFQSETGLGFSRWLAAARIQRAIVLLTDGESIDEIAAAVGFRSASAFGTAFRRVTGTSPGRFRAQ
ncbi:AraC family transcriptional regulator [Pseudoclavibacter sp. AY1F1]|uniref:helix-turn-helix domain-containing protein n=1 Tax=Pseudoclavibacter sp. AY1F1 TaxID=2080583 RepID=UPI000CE7AAA2|nr:AraC family transcriptional regulator [Pseudoclavibacter sp. AY1F1]PPF44747.1 AraC family transcriptional regulator [Pseudoclavibacter sp. AY1F1]